VFIGNNMTGGAVATGKDARATDSSRGTGPTPQDPPPAWPVSPPPPAQPGGVVIGNSMTGGAVATGPGSQAHFDARRLDPGYQELLTAMELLYDDLRLSTSSAESDALAAGLDEVSQDIARTGRAPRDRLARLRDQLTTGNAGLAALSSAVAVAEAIRGLLT
jgi:hypothetical protein